MVLVGGNGGWGGLLMYIQQYILASLRMDEDVNEMSVVTYVDVANFEMMPNFLASLEPPRL